MKNATWILLGAIVVLVVLWGHCHKEGFTSRSPLFYGYYRYGYPYSHYGTWYRPQGYWGPSYTGAPYGYGTYGYGGKQQDVYCKTGCLKAYRYDCKESSKEACDEKLMKCAELCDAHQPYYDYTSGY